MVYFWICLFAVSFKKVRGIIRFEQMGKTCVEKLGWLLTAFLELRKLITLNFSFTSSE